MHAVVLVEQFKQGLVHAVQVLPDKAYPVIQAVQTVGPVEQVERGEVGVQVDTLQVVPDRV